MQASADEQLSRAGTAVERISGYLERERDVLRGCPIGRLTQDPDVVADPSLRGPVTETLGWLQDRLASVIVEGQAAGNFDPTADPAELAATLAAVLQGGYVLARSAAGPPPVRPRRPWRARAPRPTRAAVAVRLIPTVPAP